MFVSAGVDFSMAGPAVCIHIGPVFHFENCKFHFMTSKKKYINSFDGKLEGVLFSDYLTEEERFDNISNWATSILNTFSPTLTVLEGYSYASHGRVFHIAENTGLLKHKIWKSGLKFEAVPPTTIKKLACKGNAKKEDMEVAFLAETGYNVKAMLGMTEKQWNPSSDIIDSYYMCKHAHQLQTEREQNEQEQRQDQGC